MDDKKIQEKREIIKSIGDNTKIKMNRYKYVIKDGNGKLVTDYFDAPNKVDVESFLISQGLQVVSITEDKWSKQLGLGNVRTKKFSYKELSFFLTITLLFASVSLKKLLYVLLVLSNSKNAE